MEEEKEMEEEMKEMEEEKERRRPTFGLSH